MKKLNKKLEDIRRVTPTDDDVLGWGRHIIEGLNTALVTYLTFQYFLSVVLSRFSFRFGTVMFRVDLR
jgi:hypothetical protein